METTLCRLNDDGDVEICVSQVGRKPRARCVTEANFTDLPFDVLLETRTEIALDTVLDPSRRRY
ncbi:hypothetical protein BDZ89DRAFT_1061850 [Hymenopellis radicata]|nr:hypothetical protein BDZ89DRAFT_1061850 [Hymenopellis radicata]